MKVETKEIYKCDYCNKFYQIKRFAAAHELMCSKNPENFRVCNGCQFLNKKEVDVHFDGYHGDFINKKNILHCRKIESYLYPPKVEIKGNHFYQENINDGEIPNEPMKKECEYYNDEVI